MYNIKKYKTYLKLSNVIGKSPRSLVFKHSKNPTKVFTSSKKVGQAEDN